LKATPYTYTDSPEFPKPNQLNSIKFEKPQAKCKGSRGRASANATAGYRIPEF